MRINYSLKLTTKFSESSLFLNSIFAIKLKLGNVAVSMHCNARPPDGVPLAT